MSKKTAGFVIYVLVVMLATTILVKAANGSKAGARPIQNHVAPATVPERSYFSKTLPLSLNSGRVGTGGIPAPVQPEPVFHNPYPYPVPVDLCTSSGGVWVIPGLKCEHPGLVCDPTDPNYKPDPNCH